MSGRFQGGPSFGGSACVTSCSPLAHHEVGPRKEEAKDQHVVAINPPHKGLNECSTVLAVTVLRMEISVSCIRHMIQKPHQGILKR